MHKARSFVGRIGVDGAAQMQRVVGNAAQRFAFDAQERGVYACAKASAQHQHAAGIANALDGRAAVIHAQTVLWYDIAQAQCVGGLPIFAWTCRVEKTQVLLRCLYRLCFVLHQDVNDAVGVLYVAWANSLGRVDA